MRILVVVDGVQPPAVHVTAVSIVYKLQKSLSERDVDIHILTFIEQWADPSWKEWFRNESTKNIHFHFINSRILRWLPKFLWKNFYIFKIIKLNSIYHFDIIHEYTSSFIFLIKSILYKRVLMTKVFFTICTYNLGNSGFQLFGKTKDIDKIICVNKHLTNILSRTLQNKVKFLPMGIDSERFIPDLDNSLFKKKLNISSKDLIVLYLGPIEEHKGIFYLVEAMSQVIIKHSNVKFIIATSAYGGNNQGSIDRYNENKIKILNTIKGNEDKVILLEGFHDVPKLLSVADVFAYPLLSPYGTLGLPQTLLEAMLSGKAIVAFNIVGVNELIIDGKNGLLVPINSSQMAESIHNLLLNKDLRKELGENAEYDAKEYSLDKVTTNLFKIYKESLMG